MIWLAVGAAVALWSLKLGPKFTLFFYAGLVFVAVGLVKMVVAVATRSPAHAAKHLQHPPVDTHAPVHGVPQHMHRSVHAPELVRHPAARPQAPSAAPQVFACPRCHATVNHMAYFCSQCGMRMR